MDGIQMIDVQYQALRVYRDRAWELGLCFWAGELTAAGGECWTARGAGLLGWTSGTGGGMRLFILVLPP